MITATIPIEKITVTLQDNGAEIPTAVYFSPNNIEIAFGEIISVEFALTNGKIRMVTRQFMADKLVADTQTIASLPPDHKNK
jgi:hypothetical protein